VSVTLTKPSQNQNICAPQPALVSVDGIFIDSNSKQVPNAKAPILVSPWFSVTLVSSQQSWKALVPIVNREFGVVISNTPLELNA
jgi:hypothetical protein